VVIAPTLVPTKAGDRVKTDRRDAERLASSFRAGELTPVWVPDATHEALRDLVRAREAAKQDQLRARHRLGKYLLRHGKRPPTSMRSWKQNYLEWVKREVKFDQRPQQMTLEDYLNEVEHSAVRIERLEKAIDEAVEQAPEGMRELVQALQALRGVARVGAVTIVAELGTLTRFEHPRQLMGYSGAVSSEHSSGGKTRRGGITKTGNAHVRRVIVEAAWSQRYKPVLSLLMRKRQEGLSAEVQEIASKARQRLHSRYVHLLYKGKTKQEVVTAVAREMLGFIWAIGVSVERARAQRTKGAA
jgi:transposase